MFNSLRYAQKLEEVGFTREQAETHVLMLTELMQSDLATKQDFKDFQFVTKSEMNEFRAEMRSDVTAFRAEMRSDMNKLRADMALFKQEVRADLIQMEQRLTIKLGTIISIAIGVAVTLTKIVA